MKIKELLLDSSKWTKHLDARDKDGRRVRPENPDAVCWCLIGATFKCYSNSEEAEKVLSKLKEKTVGIAEWNDAPERTFYEVKKLAEELDI